MNEELLKVVTIVGIPFLIGLLKWAWPKVPNQVLPVASIALGALIDMAATQSIGQGTAWGAAMGAAAIGVRETFDQLTGRAKKPSRLEPPSPGN